LSNEELTHLAAKLGGSVTTHVKTVELNVSPDKVLEACKSVSSMPGFYHLSTITGLDLGGRSAFSISYGRAGDSS